MNVNHLLETYINNISPVIQGVFVVILSLVFVLLFLRLKNEKGGGAESSANIEGLENTLRKVIESTQHLSAAARETSADAPAAKDGAAAVSAAKPEEIAKLQAELATKEKKLAEVMTKVGDLEKANAVAVATAPAAGAAGDTAGFEARIKDLEARLKEYEIIEDDIANLSLYKEENIRLKNELNKAAGSGATEAATPVAAEPAPAKGESLEDALKAAGGLPQVDEPPAAPSAAVAAAEPSVDLVDQLASVIDGMNANAQEPTATAVAAPVAPEAVQAASAPEKAAEPEGAVPEALAGFDPEKIMEEASALKAPEPGKEVAEDEGDVGQKLIDEFENFMKES